MGDERETLPPGAPSINHGLPQDWPDGAPDWEKLLYREVHASRVETLRYHVEVQTIAAQLTRLENVQTERLRLEEANNKSANAHYKSMHVKLEEIHEGIKSEIADVRRGLAATNIRLEGLATIVETLQRKIR
jgi:hypothetical protein